MQTFWSFDLKQHQENVTNGTAEQVRGENSLGYLSPFIHPVIVLDFCVQVTLLVSLAKQPSMFQVYFIYVR